MSDDINGCAFPFRIDAATGGVAQASGADKLRQNIRVILGTRLGERPLLREFGTSLHALVHEPNDSVLSDIIRKQAEEAIMQWERRVLVTKASVVQRDGELTLRLTYVHTTEPLSGELLVPIG